MDHETLAIMQFCCSPISLFDSAFSYSSRISFSFSFIARSHSSFNSFIVNSGTSGFLSESSAPTDDEQDEEAETDESEFVAIDWFEAEKCKCRL